MELYLFDSKLQKKLLFEPENSKNIKIYVCGPTIYSKAHIGNSRSAVIYDLLYRLLSVIYDRNNINYVRNITDIDDKIINKAKEELTLLLN